MRMRTMIAVTLLIAVVVSITLVGRLHHSDLVGRPDHSTGARRRTGFHVDDGVVY